MTRSASPPLSAWLRTSWTSPTAGVRFYWGTWESKATWSSTVPCPETQRALQGPTNLTTRVTKGFIGLVQVGCSGLTSRERQRLTAQHSFFIKTGTNHPPVIHWEPALLVHSSVFINYFERIYFHQIYSITGLELLRESCWIIWFHLSPVISCCVAYQECQL